MADNTTITTTSSTAADKPTATTADPVSTTASTVTTSTPIPVNESDAEKSNSLGIPYAEFVSDVDAFMSRTENDANATQVLKRLDESHTKYRFMEQNLMQKKRRLKKQIPDIETTIDVLKLVKHRRDNKQETETHFMLSDQVYMRSTIPATDKVCLWLGANVMLEYTIEEAEVLLTKNYDTANKNLQQIETDLDFLRDQITTTEVNMARVYNWDVKRRQSLKSQAGGDASATAASVLAAATASTTAAAATSS